ncbi:MAG: hypothetical protein EOM23_10950 [Candidatus Moranbacteria bacterium]|nr:hypothetical protein [Candidatus Moranbacteria bacterium]
MDAKIKTYHFLINENCPDLDRVIESLQNIALTRQNERIRAEILRATSTLFYAIGQHLEQIASLYKEIESLKESDRINLLVINQLWIESGIDPNIVRDHIKLSESIGRQIEQLNKTT